MRYVSICLVLIALVAAHAQEVTPERRPPRPGGPPATPTRAETTFALTATTSANSSNRVTIVYQQDLQHLTINTGQTDYRLVTCREPKDVVLSTTWQAGNPNSQVTIIENGIYRGNGWNVGFHNFGREPVMILIGARCWQDRTL